MPRPRKESGLAGGALGAILGATIGGAPGAAIGGTLGAALTRSDEKLSLRESVNKYFHSKGLEFKALSRLTKYEVEIIFRSPQRGFWTISAAVDPVPSQILSPDDLDDALYDDAVAAINEWTEQYA